MSVVAQTIKEAMADINSQLGRLEPQLSQNRKTIKQLETRIADLQRNYTELEQHLRGLV